MKTSRPIGIDLGTTNSVVAILGPDNKTIVCYEDKKTLRRTVPSVVTWDVDKKTKVGRVIVGQSAFNCRGTRPEPITSIKRKMGDMGVTVPVGGQQMTPVEVSASILRDLAERMRKTLACTPGCEEYVIDRAVITIPAYFRSNAREATTAAGRLAGLEVELTLQEPTAAAIYYCWKNQIEDGIFLVYDLGGGTFDVSIVRYAAGDADVLGIAGNNYLGGDNFDELLADYLLKFLQEDEDGYDLDLNIVNDPDDAMRFTKLKLIAEVIKKALTEKEEHLEQRDGIFTDKQGRTVNLSIKVTRQDFEELIYPTIMSTIPECWRAVEEAKGKVKDFSLNMVDCVLLVGGSTYVPLVREVVRRELCDPQRPEHTKHPAPVINEPDMAVGFGAALVAGNRSERKYDEHAEGALNFGVEVGKAINIHGKSTVGGKFTCTGMLSAPITAKVSRHDGTFCAQFPVELLDENGAKAGQGKAGEFKFTGLPARNAAEPYQCELIKDGAVLYSFQFDAGVPDINVVPVVLSHTLYVDLFDPVTREIKREVLMEKGKTLPASGGYDFETNESEQRTRIIIYEDSIVLKEIVLEYKRAMKAGTPVRFDLRIDDKSIISYRAAVGDTVEEGVVPPPPAPPPITMEMLTEKLAAFNALKAYLTSGEQIVNSVKFDNLLKVARKAIADGDQGFAREAFDDICRFLSGIQPVIIKPEQKAFDALLDSCDALNKQYKNDPDIATAIRNHRNEGHAYYEEKNQQGVTLVYNRVIALRKELEEKEVPPPPEEPRFMKSRRMAGLVYQMLDSVPDDSKSVPAELLAQKQPDIAKVEALFRMANQFATDEILDNVDDQLRTIYWKWEQVVNTEEPDQDGDIIRKPSKQKR